jgi:ribosomal protein S18 acetylase RimI-like enzyme
MVRTTNAAVVAFYERLGYSDQSTAVLGKFLDPELEELKRRLS